MKLINRLKPQYAEALEGQAAEFPSLVKHARQALERESYVHLITLEDAMIISDLLSINITEIFSIFESCK